MRYDDKNKSSHDNQRAWDYIMYMMLGSYFKKTNCLTTFWEQKLSLNYSAMKKQDQYAAEDKCIKVIEEEILPQLPEEFLESTVDIKLVVDEKDDVTVIEVTDGVYELMVAYKYDVKKVEIKDKADAEKGIKKFSKNPLKMSFREL
jgi:hypothetical protein